VAAIMIAAPQLMPAVAKAEPLELEKDEVKFGFIKLTDMAPLAIAYEKGFFEEEGLYVTLEPQANWKVLLDRVITGELDGAHMLAGQPLAATIGYGTKAHIVTPFSMDLNGNGITVSNAIWDMMKLSMLDGYLTIGFDGWHVHLCIGEHRGTPDNPVDPVLARRRQCAHAELQRSWAAGAPCSWMVRLFNGDGDQQLTVLLPHPFLDDEQRIVDAPDWGRLELWDRLRERFLGLPPDPVDRSADRFVHA
jgi:hypothetical protein